MKNKVAIKLLTICLLALASAPVLEAEYYYNDLFLIGLTGINHTGFNERYIDPDKKIENPDYNCPYDNANPDVWGWEEEEVLIHGLGVNCIGCSDGTFYYYVDWTPTKNGDRSDYSYLTRVCKPLMEQNDTFLLIPHTCRVHPQRLRYVTLDGEGNITQTFPCNSPQYDPPGTFSDQEFNAIFRSYHSNQQGAYGSEAFYGHLSPDKEYDCYGDEGDNWKTRDGDDPYLYQSNTIYPWQAMADEAIETYEDFFEPANNPDYLEQYIWGVNILVENPAVGRNFNLTPTWHGCWAAVDRVLRGKNTSFSFAGQLKSEHEGFRGVEFFDDKDRMVVAKNSLHELIQADDLGYSDYNIFQWLPDIDVWVLYTQPIMSEWNYGYQDLFDYYIYGVDNNKNGFQHFARYMQKYGKTNLRPSQMRRLVMGFSMEWDFDNDDGPNPIYASARRPCPPEIRAICYLAISRGYKGILFHNWTGNEGEIGKNPPIILDPSQVKIPDFNHSSSTMENFFGLGLRDLEGYPFGYDNRYGGSPHSTHYLNNGDGTTYWHGNDPNHPEAREDRTYWYLADELIPEIKAISSVLMQLDWVNGYSLNSTDPEWASPCPHDYVADVWGVSYMDLALFDHPYEPIGVEYFMLVNREGIADMTNRTVSVALDAGHWPQEDSLVLTDIAHRDSPQTLVRQGDRYTFTQVFEPGEGKLYRVAPINEAPIAINNNRP